MSARVRRTGRPARFEDYRRARGPIAELARATEWQVGRRRADRPGWAALGRDRRALARRASRRRATPRSVWPSSPSCSTAAIANADSREQLTASRARLLTAADDARRRVVRDLHDGAQQRLVHTIITLKLAGAGAGCERRRGGRRSWARRSAHAELGNEELRELAHGILPAALTHGGLRAGLDAVVARLDVPVRHRRAARAVRGRDRGERVLRRGGGADQRRQARRRAARRGPRDSSRTGCSTSTFATTASAARIRAGTAWWASRDRVTALGGRLAVGEATGGGTLVAASMPLVVRAPEVR